MSVWIFSLAALLSLPKQFATVYIGVIIEGSGKGSFKTFLRFFARLKHDPAETSPQRIASFLLIAVTTIVTFLAAWYIYRELNRVKPAVIYGRRKARYVDPSLSFIAFETHRRHAI